MDWLYPKGLSKVFSNTTVQKHQFFGVQVSLWSNSHTLYITTGKTVVLTMWTFIGKVMSFLFSMLSRFVITFLPGIKNLLVSWLQSLSAVLFMSTKCLPYTILCALNSISFHHHSNPLNVVLLLSLSYWWRNKGTSRLHNFVGSYISYRLKWQIWDLNSLIQHSYISLEISGGQGTTLIPIFNY